MTKKKALITGINGQDGSFLAELLLEKDYEVHGIVRRNSISEHQQTRLDHISKELHVEYGDLLDASSLEKSLKRIQPDEIYNLAAQSHVRISFDIPQFTFQTNALGVLNLLEAYKNNCPNAKLYQASSSEMFGNSVDVDNFQRETTPMHPVSPYGCAKLAAYSLVRNYRQSYKLFASNGILFNHESKRRSSNFVTSKVVKTAVAIKFGLQDKLELGNMDSYRDWGHSKDYCIDLDTKILTDNGFKHRHEISENDRLINYNIKNDSWEFDKINTIYDVEHTGPMYNFSGNGWSFRCSPNHRFYYQQKTPNSKNWYKTKEIVASELYEKLYDKSLRTKYDYRLIGIQQIDNKKEYDITNNMLELIGYIIAEGCLSKSKIIGGGMTLSVSQSKKKYYSKLKKIIDNLALVYREKERPDEVVEFIFSAESRDIILDYFPKNDIHIIPDFIYKLSNKQLYFLFTALMEADGCWSNMSYSTNKFHVADKFQDLCSLLGIKSKIHRRKSGQYETQIFSKAKKTTWNYITACSKEEYVEENLWCVEAENNSTIITKKENHGIVASGNCKAMWMILQQDAPIDLVISTMQTHSVRELVNYVFERLELDPDQYVTQNQKFIRPEELKYLKGDSSKARNLLGWKPEYTFETLLDEMIAFWVDHYNKKVSMYEKSI